MSFKFTDRDVRLVKRQYGQIFTIPSSRNICLCSRPNGYVCPLSVLYLNKKHHHANDTVQSTTQHRNHFKSNSHISYNSLENIGEGKCISLSFGNSSKFSTRWHWVKITFLSLSTRNIVNLRFIQWWIYLYKKRCTKS